MVEVCLQPNDKPCVENEKERENESIKTENQVPPTQKQISKVPAITSDRFREWWDGYRGRKAKPGMWRCVHGSGRVGIEQEAAAFARRDRYNQSLEVSSGRDPRGQANFIVEQADAITGPAIGRRLLRKTNPKTPVSAYSVTTKARTPHEGMDRKRTGSRTPSPSGPDSTHWSSPVAPHPRTPWRELATVLAEESPATTHARRVIDSFPANAAVR